MISLNIDQIKEAIPQRDPMLMVDEIVAIDPGKRVVGLKHITGVQLQPGVDTIGSF